MEQKIIELKVLSQDAVENDPTKLNEYLLYYTYPFLL